MKSTEKNIEWLTNGMKREEIKTQSYKNQIVNQIKMEGLDKILDKPKEIKKDGFLKRFVKIFF